MINFNLSATFNIVRILFKPSICLPHHTVSNFNDLPIPLDKALQREGRAATDIRAVVLDKDDCFAYPSQNEVYPDYKDKFEALQSAYPGRRLLIVSNTAGAQSWDPKLKLAVEVEKNTGVSVLSHSVKKPGCGREIMEYFEQHPETGVTHPSQIAVVGDRLTTDMMLANMMGGWGFWIRDGVIPLKKKSFTAVSNAEQFSRIERPLSAFLMARGVVAMDPRSPFEE
uniref:Phosphatidylglycerophosphatase GEP4, mitochondrial n=1 Tax=Bionectria ochroleuca TaxID=29856 RepID=A0A0B7K7W6_BIOOC